MIRLGSVTGLPVVCAGKLKGGGERMKRPKDMVRAILREQQKKNPTDPLGSWTGVPFNEDEEPVQDADDL